MLRGPARPPRPAPRAYACAYGAGARLPAARETPAAGRGGPLRCGPEVMEPPKVEKFSTANRGNGLRALAQLRPGELLFRSDPLAYTVCKGSRGVVCDRCLLGYVRSAVAHPSPRRAGDVVGLPAGSWVRDAAGSWVRTFGGCCPGAQPRVFRGASRLAGDWVRGLGGVPGSAPVPPWGRAGPGSTPRPCPRAAVGTGGSRRGRAKGQRCAAGNFTGEPKVCVPGGTLHRCGPGGHSWLGVVVGAQGCVPTGLGSRDPPGEDPAGRRRKNLAVYRTLSRVQVVFRLELRT